jgi:molybdopterin/thiamine biosynthesis adenylyltransferase
MEENIFSRQLDFFGKDGQEKLEKIHVGIVGLGGIGSHMIQQLAYLGVRRYTIIDHDFVEDTNLNRLIGASIKDLEAPLSKIANAIRMIRFVRPEEEYYIKSISERFPSKESLEALETVDIIFGCVDRDGPRLILTEFSAAYEKPYIDLATEIHPEHKTFGGRIFFSIPGSSCLHCRGELSVEEIRKDLQNDTEVLEEEAIYGVSKAVLNGSGPSVVSLNGAIAYLAGIEFMAYVTGVRKPKELLDYDGSLGIVKINKDVPTNNCYYCKFIKGMKQQANIARYVGMKQAS